MAYCQSDFQFDWPPQNACLSSDMNAPLVSSAADRLSNALRLYAEASINSKALFSVDKEEAIDNLDRAFDGILNGFHSMYDAMIAAKLELNWHAHGDTAACILVRNARHHNAEGLFDSWNSIMLKRGGLGRMAGAAFLLVGYQLVGEGGWVSEYYVPFDDFKKRLEMPASRIKDPAAIAALFDRECGFAAIRDQASKERYPANQVYLNMIPIVMNAATRVYSTIRAAGVELSGFDSTTYADHFADNRLTTLTAPTFKSIRVTGY